MLCTVPPSPHTPHTPHTLPHTPHTPPHPHFSHHPHILTPHTPFPPGSSPQWDSWTMLLFQQCHGRDHRSVVSSTCIVQSLIQSGWYYRIACNFRGAKYSWFSWLEVWPRIFYPRMKRPYLPLPAVQAATTKIYPLNVSILLNHEPRIFCPPKITRYTVLQRTRLARVGVGQNLL